MSSKKILFLSLSFLLISCIQSNKYEKAMDYFYPLEKGTVYIYKYGEFLIERKIEDINLEKSTIKISEKMSKEGKHKIMGKNIYIYEIKDNLIKVKRGIFKGSIQLKGPIKKGTKWKAKSYEFNIQEGKKVTHVTKAWIDGFKEMNVFNSKRKCIVIKTYEIVGANRSIATSIWCKGIGFVEGATSAGKIA
ncbi:MAG: hypothetical protein QXP04_03840 [Candidatus Nanoarchaeia archaeon]|nr:hypothetical protein [Candidatus Jingweiarchaeum tengchongense]